MSRGLGDVYKRQSQMSSKKFVKHPLDVVSVGDIVDVKVLDVDLNKKRISLSMKLGEEKR